MKEKIKRNFIYWLRWIAVLPGAIAFGLLVFALLYLILYFTMVFTDGIIPGSNISMYILFIFFPFIFAIACIFAGVKIAPKYKFQTRIVLTVISLLWAVLYIYFMLRPL